MSHSENMNSTENVDVENVDIESADTKKTTYKHKLQEQLSNAKLKPVRFLSTVKGQNLLQYRFFREPYWLGFVPVVIITLTALIAIGLAATPLKPLAMPVALILCGLQIRMNYRYVRGYVKEQEEIAKEDPSKAYQHSGQASFLPASFTKEQERKRTQNSYFDNLVYGYHVLYFVTALLCMYAAYATQSYLVGIFLALLWGFFIAPIAESWSHEFIHRRSLGQQMLGASLWATFCYGTFLPEHTMGHHVHVSTPEDPSSAPKGMTLYQFLPQAIIKNPINGFKLEAKRLRDRGLSVWHPRNRLIWLSTFSVLWALLSYQMGGSYGLLFWLISTIGSIVTIEVANYLMHYGLERQKLDNGRYERVSPLHSWNAEGPIHMAIINLTRHSDHHAFPRRPYQILRYFPEAPQLPVSYDRLFFLTWFPSYFFKIMDPQVDKHMEKLKDWKENHIDDYERVMDLSNV